ncbi:MAG: membrane protein insertion efficiency factor YidD [Elusimicrobia bacterium]|nr:membrane protein insertion efficiency factor YidD [Elusimicrobiota bacterium]
MIQFAALELLGLFRAVRSALFPACCRFYPSCTDYAEEALKLHGCVRAIPRVLRRLSRCQPFHPGGFDPVV